MTELMQTLEDVFAIISAVPVTGDGADMIAAARKKLRDAYQLLDREEKGDG